MAQPEEWLLKEKYDGVKSKEFFADCKRLALGEPLAYLIGWTPFLDCQIYLDSKPLIPRPETESWVEQAIATMKESQGDTLGFEEASISVLDLCAGSGCIGVATARALPSAQVEFAEIDAKHLPTILKNIEANGIDLGRTTIMQSNLFADIEGRYDFILSNPPYIDAELNRVDDSVSMNEPHLALFGGRGGLDVIKDIIESAPNHLRTGGQLWLEHEPEQSAEIARIGEASGFAVSTYKDQYDMERYSILVLQ